MKDEYLKEKFFYSLKKTQIVIGIWKTPCNRIQRHSSLSYRPSAPVTFPDLAVRLHMPIAMS